MIINHIAWVEVVFFFSFFCILCFIYFDLSFECPLECHAYTQNASL